MDCDRGLADAAFLIKYRDDLGHIPPAWRLVAITILRFFPSGIPIPAARQSKSQRVRFALPAAVCLPVLRGSIWVVFLHRRNVVNVTLRRRAKAGIRFAVNTTFPGKVVLSSA